MRKCRHCGKRFHAEGFAIACSTDCAIAFVRTRPERMEAHRRQVERRVQREAKRDLEPASTAMRKAQSAFNAWVRARDAGKPCVSCGHPDDGSRQRHAGHYRPAGPNPALRFEEDNVHAQCSVCNNHLSGNLVGYRAELINRIGLAQVEWLEGPHDLPRRRLDDYRTVESLYKARLKAARTA